MADEMLPCPFCGKKPWGVEIFGWRIDPEPSKLWGVQHSCGYVPGHGDTKEDAIASWNRRADNGKAAVIERIRALLP